MRVATIVRRLLGGCEESVHRARLEAVQATVEGIVCCRQLTPAAIGRSVARGTTAKHGIRRVDRLLGNKALHAEYGEYFGCMAARVLCGVERPLILVDWTQVTGRFRALYAAVAFEGRAIALYEEVHHERYLGNTYVQNRFLQRLKALLPEGIRPVIASDAGFHGAFFQQVRQLGWDFVGRIRGTAKVRDANGTVHSKEELYRQARLVPTDLGPVRLYAKRSVAARLVLVRQRRRPGRRRAATSKDEREYRRQAKDPWLLATSLSLPSADAIVALYSRRMQIEETFRDAKNHRFGWSLRHVRSKKRERLAVLLMLAALAMLAVALLGVATEVAGLARHFQANTLKRRVLSFFSLGCAYLDSRGRRARLRLSAALSYLYQALCAPLAQPS